MHNTTKSPSSDGWDKAKAVSTILASVVIPVAVAFVGNSYSNALKEREFQIRYVELALQILAKEPNDKNITYANGLLT